MAHRRKAHSLRESLANRRRVVGATSTWFGASMLGRLLSPALEQSYPPHLLTKEHTS